MDTVRLDVLGHADFNGAFRKTKESPGMRAFAGAIDSVRGENPDGTILLDAGDNFCRQLWRGRQVAEGLSVLHTDAMTLGNHEFDEGREFLEESIAACPFPVLCANVTDRKGNPVKGTKPWVMLEKKGIRIGVIGVTTEYTPYMVEASAFSEYQMSSAASACRAFIGQAREAGAQLIVILAHMPFYIKGEPSGELIELWEAIRRERPDILIGGHIPGDFARVMGDAIVLKGGFKGKSLPHARIDYDPARRKILHREAEIIDVSRVSRSRDDPKISAFLNKTVEPFQPFFEEPIAVVEDDLPMRLSAESPLGDLFADIVREAAGTDFVYMNATGVGRGLKKGKITRADVMEAMGFNDPIMLGKIRGEQLRDLLEAVYEPARFGNNAGLIFSGFAVELDHSRPAGRKVLSLRLLSGQPVEMRKEYSVATSRYMASGGNDTGGIAKGIIWEDSGMRMNEALYAQLQRQGTIRAPALGRCIEHGRPENDHSPY